MLNNTEKEKWIDESTLNTLVYKKKLEKLKNIDLGGFEHGDLSSQYAYFQNNSRYESTRYFGWNSLFKIINKKSRASSCSNQLIIDFLAGSGTLAQRVKQLWLVNSPKVIGIEASKRMSQLASEKGGTVFWGSHNTHIIKDNVADFAVAAYGFHHIPENERHAFVSSMHKVLKHEGICLLQDFVESSTTAKFYSECIHKYRPNGHPYKHFTEESFVSLMSSYFKEIETRLIYDPFYLEGSPGQNECSLKRECLAYIISLFNLRRLVPTSIDITELFFYQNKEYWDEIEKMLLPFFKLEEDECKKIQSNIMEYDATPAHLKDIRVPFVSKPTIQSISNASLAIIMPRSALISVGLKK